MLLEISRNLISDAIFAGNTLLFTLNSAKILISQKPPEVTLFTLGVNCRLYLFLCSSIVIH